MKEITQHTIIGDVLTPYRVYFEGRPQSGTLYASTDSECIANGKDIRDQLKDENPHLFASSDKWEVRLLD